MSQTGDVTPPTPAELAKQLESLKLELQEVRSEHDKAIKSDVQTGPASTGSNAKQVPDLESFKFGQNFTTFCKRFCDWVYLSRKQDPHLYLYLLQLVDEKTYSILSPVEVPLEDRDDAESFCRFYQNVYYPATEQLALKTEINSCRQESGESIEDYTFRLSELVSRAYSQPDRRDEVMLLALLEGVYDDELKTKLQEAVLSNFQEAKAMALRLEKVSNRRRRAQHLPTSVLKQTVAWEDESTSQKRRLDDTDSHSSDQESTNRRSRRRDRSPHRSDSRSRDRDSYRRDSRNRDRDSYRRDSRSRDRDSYRRDSGRRDSHDRSSFRDRQYFSNSSTLHRSNNRRNSTYFECYNCGKPYHLARECRSAVRNSGSQNGRGSSNRGWNNTYRFQGNNNTRRFPVNLMNNSWNDEFGSSLAGDLN